MWHVLGAVVSRLRIRGHNTPYGVLRKELPLAYHWRLLIYEQYKIKTTHGSTPYVEQKLRVRVISILLPCSRVQERPMSLTLQAQAQSRVLVHLARQSIVFLAPRANVGP